MSELTPNTSVNRAELSPTQLQEAVQLASNLGHAYSTYPDSQDEDVLNQVIEQTCAGSLNYAESAFYNNEEGSSGHLLVVAAEVLGAARNDGTATAAYSAIERSRLLNNSEITVLGNIASQAASLRRDVDDPFQATYMTLESVSADIKYCDASISNGGQDENMRLALMAYGLGAAASVPNYLGGFMTMLEQTVEQSHTTPQ